VVVLLRTTATSEGWESRIPELRMFWLSMG